MNATKNDIPEINAIRKVLLLAGSDPGTVLLKEILAKHAELSSASDIPEMLSLLAQDGCDVLFCDWRFPMGSWRDAVEAIQNWNPELPVIVICRTGKEREWREVIEAGAFDLVTEFYPERAVLSVLEHALASRDGRAFRTVA